MTRTVDNTKPVTVSYALTDHAIETQPVINALIEFGLKRFHLAMFQTPF
ncbi:winged helix-turn-helix transcriptional regulator [Pedobacter sp. KBW06]|nr:hypothetical protein [Pedobacter sp. KBW06]